MYAPEVADRLQAWLRSPRPPEGPGRVEPLSGPLGMIMSEELKKLEVAWAACEKKISALFSELDGAAQTEKNLKDWLDGAREDLVERVITARKAGATGTKVADFLKNGAVAKAWSEIQATLTKLRAGHDRFQAAVVGFKPVHEEAEKLVARINAEVAARKKKVTESKSVPDLEKLGKTITTAITRNSPKLMNSAASFAKAKPANFTYATKYEARIDADIASGANSIKESADADTLVSQLAPRHLAAVGGRVGELAKASAQHCADAIAHHKAGDKAGAKAAYGQALAKAEAAQKEAEGLQKALKAGAEAVKSSKDGPEILKKLNTISGLVGAALRQVATTQKAIA